MAEIIRMPRLSDTMEEGTVAKWLKKVGDQIKEGDILAEIETDKATMEFESFNEGELLHIGIPEGGSAAVDSLLAIIGNKGEDISSLLSEKNLNVLNSEEKQTDVHNGKNSTDDSAALPDGVEIITMPRLSDTMEEGTVAKWNKKIGDQVKEGDILAEIETDKATMEFESFYSGTLLYIGLQEGDSAPVDSVLAVIGEKGTEVKAWVESQKVTTNTPIKTEDIVTVDHAPIQVPKVKENSTQISQPQKSTSQNGRIVASPLAKKLAIEKGIDLSRIYGSGDQGRIIKRDIDQYPYSRCGKYSFCS